MTKTIILISLILILDLGFYFLFISKKLMNPKLEKSMIEEVKPQLNTKIKTEPEIKNKISIITVYDNYQVDPRLKTGWGFSALVKTKNQNILFDTGAGSETLLSNMEKMEIDSKKIEMIVLFHIHGDHIGGLEGFLEKNGNVKVYIPASFPDSIREKIESFGGEYRDVLEPSEISGGVYSTGELGILIKEQSLILNSEKGLIIITGCAHPGIVDIVKRTKEIFPKEKVYLVLGGFHLAEASDSELKGIIADFRELGVGKVAPCHCSGDRCRELFKQEYQNDFIENGVGRIIEI